MSSLRAITIVLFYLVFELALIGESQLLGAANYTPRVVEILSVVGTGIAAFSLHADDPPRRPWMVFFLAMITVPTARLVGTLGINVGPFPLKVLILIVSNIAIVAALYMFTRVLRDSGLTPEWDDPEHRGTRNMLIGAVTVLGLAAVANEVLVIRLSAAAPDPMVQLVIQTVSTTADALICAAGLYLMWLVRPLMGGSVAQPYLLIAIGGGVFIVTDFLSTFNHVATQDEFSSPVAAGIAMLGWASFALAGLAQARLLRTAENH